jgi:fumarylacetoacetase
MIPKTDGTHDPALRSFVESANDPAGDFPVQNLPLGAFRRGGDGRARVGCAIGDRVLDLLACGERGLLRGLPADVEAACAAESLNALMALDPRVRGTLRHRLSHLLRTDGGFVTARSDAADVLVPRADAEMQLPAVVGDYTDFYASAFHATNVGRMLRPDNPLLPNYKWVPIGYHGRASSLVVSGTEIARPQGQTEPAEGGEPRFGPTRSLDYELEVAAFLGPGNPLGAPIPIAEAERLYSHFCTSRAPRATRSRCPTSRTRKTVSTAASTSGSRCSSPRRRCASAAFRRSGSATATCATSTGRSRRWSRTTARTAATCGPGT